MFNPVINHVSLKFLFPIVSPRDVAQKVLDAIAWRRNEIILPYHLKYLGLINDFILPQWLSDWVTFQISGKRPLDLFNRDTEENTHERRRKPLHTIHKENIDLI